MTYPRGVAEETSRSEPKIVQRLRDKRESHAERGRVYRYAFVVAGFLVLLAGLAMLALPGPAFLVVPVGLAILSLEFAWAGRLLEHALDRADSAREKAAGASPAQKRLSVAAGVSAAAAFAAAAVVWDIPLLPV